MVVEAMPRGSKEGLRPKQTEDYKSMVNMTEREL